MNPDQSVFTVALAGNPNVGKSTLFNALTGLRRHTGNWTGKTVDAAAAEVTHDEQRFRLLDLPGAYSLLPHSAEEDVTRDALCFDRPDAVIVVCDATALEHTLPLVLQVMELTDRVGVCVNLIDDAARRHIRVDSGRLSALLGVPVVETAARRRRGLAAVMDMAAQLVRYPNRQQLLRYDDAIEAAVLPLEEALSPLVDDPFYRRFLALRLLEGDDRTLDAAAPRLGCDLRDDPAVSAALSAAALPPKEVGQAIASKQIARAEEVARAVVSSPLPPKRAGRLDRILTGRYTGRLCMAALLCVLLWITIVAANRPSAWLAAGFSALESPLRAGLEAMQTPPWLLSLLLDGVYRTLSWVVAVMLPPMAIFFPLFTLLEDSGYLPRIAFNLDGHFQKAGACGKQGLTMCMGLGCNAVGVTGCRIIDSPRERQIAMLTNSFVPCNGRFGAILSLIALFLVLPLSLGGVASSLLSAVLLSAVIVCGVLCSLAASRLLSRTVCKGLPSSFALELPPYRRPAILQVLTRSLFDRTLKILGRAAAVAAPAGLVIWGLSHLSVGDLTLLQHITEALDPVGRLLGLDGVILTAFLLGFPANEIVLPLALMGYLSAGAPVDLSDLSALHTVLAQNGWTPVTAVCYILFSLCHFPCATTCATVYKETKSLKQTALAVLLPTAFGVVLCMAVNALAHIL